MKNFFQKLHYNKITINPFLKGVLGVGEFFYKKIINYKNLKYELNPNLEKKVEPYVICVGNITTGGVGKTPIVINLANSFKEPVAIISRGYGAKLSSKTPVIIKDFKGLKFPDGRLCGDEPFQIARAVRDNVAVIICTDRAAAADFAYQNYGIKKVILDDGFSNRKIKKDKTIVAIDSKMRFGNGHLLPLGPLREPVEEIKRASEIILVDKADENLEEAINWVKGFNKPIKICSMKPKKIYNLQTGATVLNPKRAVAFCAIGQPEQFFKFAREFYDLAETKAFSDHYKYTKKDIKELIKIAANAGVNTFITTQKDEAKLKTIIKDIKDYSFNVLELKTVIE